LAPPWSQIEKGNGLIVHRWTGEKGGYERWTDLRPFGQFSDGYRAELRLMRLIRRKPQTAARSVVTARLVGILGGEVASRFAEGM
jgi:hypothetical protein